MAENKRRRADYFAGPGSLAGGLRRRREEIEKGNVEGASEAFRQGIKKEEEIKRAIDRFRPKR